jgi:exosortase
MNDQPSIEASGGDIPADAFFDASAEPLPEAAIAAPAPSVNTPLELNDLSEKRWMGLTASAWIQIAVVAALFAALFWPNLRRLWDKTNPFTGEANWGHAIGIPIIGLYFLYVNREKLWTPDEPAKLSPLWQTLQLWGLGVVVLFMPLVLVKLVVPGLFKRWAMVTAALAAADLAWCYFGRNSKMVAWVSDHSAGWFGVAVMLFGIAMFGYGIYPGQNDFVKDFGMVITLFGIVLALTGWGVMHTAWFPIVFLVCAIPWPGLMYSRIAGPLQQLAANVAVRTLELTGVEASANGTKILISGNGGAIRTLNVAEACAGLRSLMTFISVGAAVAFLSHRPLWEKILITVSAIPIAIFCNVMRVSGQGLLDHYVSQQLSENFAHQFVGMIMLIPAFLLILLIGWLLDRIFVEEADQRREAPRMIRRAVAVAPVMVAPRPASVLRSTAPPRTTRAVNTMPTPMAAAAPAIRSAPAKSKSAQSSPVSPAAAKGNPAPATPPRPAQPMSPLRAAIGRPIGPNRPAGNNGGPAARPGAVVPPPPAGSPLRNRAAEGPRSSSPIKPPVRGPAGTATPPPTRHLAPRLRQPSPAAEQAGGSSDISSAAPPRTAARDSAPAPSAPPANANPMRTPGPAKRPPAQDSKREAV